MNYTDEILYAAENGRCADIDYPATEENLWERLRLLPAQLSRFPLFSPAEAATETVIGKNALVPLRLSMPVIISHMSCGAVSPQVKIALAKAATEAGIAVGSGGGGVLTEEMELSSAYIYEYTPGLYSLSPEILERCAAVEIKIGQGCLGGLPEELPPDSPDWVYEMRRGVKSPFFSSPGRFSDLNSAEDLGLLIEGLREGCGGKPVGVKIAAGHLEEDLEIILRARADFVTVDGGCGGRWASSALRRCGIPAPLALSRAVKYLEKSGGDIDIIIAGGIRSAADIAKALALGAKAAAPASAVLTAACGALRGDSPYPGAETTRRAVNYFKALDEGLREICAYTGRASAAELCREDVECVNFFEI